MDKWGFNTYSTKLSQQLLSYLKKSEGHYMGPATEIVINFLWIVNFRKRLCPHLRPIVEIANIGFQGFEISLKQIGAREFCQTVPHSNISNYIKTKKIYIWLMHSSFQPSSSQDSRQWTCNSTVLISNKVLSFVISTHSLTQFLLAFIRREDVVLWRMILKSYGIKE